ncbi:MAG: hypothetical protein ACJ786_10220 [Catenulispora sp.]
MTGPGGRLLSASIRLLPPHRREFGAALLAEASAVPGGWRRVKWLAGGVWFVLTEGAMRRLVYGLGLAVAAALLVGVDRAGTSDDSGQVSLLVLLAGAAVLGAVAPRWAWLAALVLGSSLAVAGMVAATLGTAPAHLPPPGGLAGAATLFLLILPAAAGAYLGAGAGWLLRYRRETPH